MGKIFYCLVAILLLYSLFKQMPEIFVKEIGLQKLKKQIDDCKQKKSELLPETISQSISVAKMLLTLSSGLVLLYDVVVCSYINNTWFSVLTILMMTKTLYSTHIGYTQMIKIFDNLDKMLDDYKWHPIRLLISFTISLFFYLSIIYFTLFA